VNVLLLPIGASAGLNGWFEFVHGLKKKPFAPLPMPVPMVAVSWSSWIALSPPKSRPRGAARSLLSMHNVVRSVPLYSPAATAVPRPARAHGAPRPVVWYR